MSDIIRLLPEAVANQIAAGEVVQRPSSVVKELLENAIDAGASLIKLIVKDSGKTIIQVIDNGVGMSETDARMSFERHATSKIKKAEDLFHISTKGFRGEALASIAAVAQVELKTRRSTETLGSKIEIEGSKIRVQEPVQCAEGTNMVVKNLFFNIPARRYFLKSDAIELRHIIDEVQRVALTHPDIEFNFTHNGTEVFALPPVSLRQRIVHIFGNKYNEKLVPVEEETDFVRVSGYVGKPDASRKTRGEQFFFINNRFIRNTYLNHAVMSAYEKILPAGHFPLYLIYLEMDPSLIDINIHPTKTEVKFQDERSVYAIIHAAVRRALGKFNISPSLDFDQESSIEISPVRKDQELRQPRIDINPAFNPFGAPSDKSRDKEIADWFDRKEKSTTGWSDLLQIATRDKSISQPVQPAVETKNVDLETAIEDEILWTDEASVMQVMRRYIITSSNGSLLLIDQQRAHQRVLFERLMQAMEVGKAASQRLLFPEDLDLSTTGLALLTAHLDTFEALGFSFEYENGQIKSVTGIPSESGAHDAHKLIEEIIDQIASEQHEVTLSSREKIAWALACSSSIRYGQMLTEPEMTGLIHNLFQCRMPQVSKGNKQIILRLTLDQLAQQFK